MDSKCHSCQNITFFDDYCEGNVVCYSCGLVTSPLFLNQINSVSHVNQETNILSDIQHLLDKIHVPICYGNQIESYYCKNFTTKSKTSLVFAIYKVLNDLEIPISMKEISNVSSVDKKCLNRVQHENQFINFDSNAIVEKYCVMLGLNFKTITLIKNKINSLPISGHNPNSILASVIYQICKEQKIKISIKHIAEITSVSCISIQRYNTFYKKIKNVYGS